MIEEGSTTMMRSRTSKNERGKKSKATSKRKRLSSKEVKELKAQIEEGEELPNIQRMKLAYEGENWDFLRSCASAQLKLDPRSTLSIIYLGVALKALGKEKQCQKMIERSVDANSSYSQLSYAVARWYTIHGYKHISMAFYAMHLYQKNNYESEGLRNAEFKLAFQEFQQLQGVDPSV